MLLLVDVEVFAAAYSMACPGRNEHGILRVQALLVSTGRLSVRKQLPTQRADGAIAAAGAAVLDPDELTLVLEFRRETP